MDELPALSRVPSAILLQATDKMRLAFSRDKPGLFVGRALYRQARADLLAPGLRAWALMVSEVACPRQPGGVLPPDDQMGAFRFGPGVVGRGAQSHDKTCDCGNWRNHDRDAWMVAMGESMHAVRDRDGERLFEVFRRTVYEGNATAEIANNFSASLASSACSAAADAGLSRDLEALLHSLAYHAHSPQAWSVAGVVYRLAAATLACVDLGPSMAQEILSPEIDALGALSTQQRLIALGVVGPAYAELLADHPLTEVDSIGFRASPHGVPADTSRETVMQQRGAAVAGQLAIAYRRIMQAKSAQRVQRMDELTGLVSRGGNGEVLLGVYALTNLLAVRMRQLYG